MNLIKREGFVIGAVIVLFIALSVLAAIIVPSDLWVTILPTLPCH